MDSPNPADAGAAPTTPPAEITPPETATDPVVAELKGIRGKLDNISRKVDAFAAENGIDQPAANSNASHSARWIAATGMSALGLKVGALIGAKIGFFGGLLFGKHGIKAQPAQKAEDANSWWKFLYMREAGIGAAIGGVTGAVGGGMLGWVRGEHIKNPRDFFVHPMKTASILLFGDKQQTQEASDAGPGAETKADTSPPSSATWQTRTQSAPELAVPQR